jgi:hypothetical protein
LITIILFVGLWLAVTWYNNHPAVRLRRRMRASVRTKMQADHELETAYQQARAKMDRIARNWKNR